MGTLTRPAIEGAVCNAPTPDLHREEFFVSEMNVEVVCVGKLVQLRLTPPFLFAAPREGQDAFS